MVLENGELRVTLSLGEDSVSGEVTRADRVPQPFTATLASGDAGLYRAEETFEGFDDISGWIVLNDGRQQEAVTVNLQSVESPELDTVSGRAEASVSVFLPSLIIGCPPMPL